jgi:hypothetical protein
MPEYIEIVCMSASDMFGEMSRKTGEDFEFVSVISKGPGMFLLRMRRRTSKTTSCF